MWHFMNREVQKEHVVPVSSYIPSDLVCVRRELILSGYTFIPQLENARAVIDLYRSIEADCEAAVAEEDWLFILPPDNFARCYL